MRLTSFCTETHSDKHMHNAISVWLSNWMNYTKINTNYVQDKASKLQAVRIKGQMCCRTFCLWARTSRMMRTASIMPPSPTIMSGKLDTTVTISSSLCTLAAEASSIVTLCALKDRNIGNHTHIYSRCLRLFKKCFAKISKDTKVAL